MITKETFSCGSNTLVGLSAKEVLEFLFSRSVGCGYHLVTDYINVGFSMGIPYGTARFDVIHFNDRNSHSKGFIGFEFDYIKPNIWDDERNIINYTLTAGKITSSSVSLNPDYVDEIFRPE